MWEEATISPFHSFHEKHVGVSCFHRFIHTLTTYCGHKCRMSLLSVTVTLTLYLFFDLVIKKFRNTYSQYSIYLPTLQVHGLQYILYGSLKTTSSHSSCKIFYCFLVLIHRLFTANSFDLIDEDAFLGLPHLEYL